MKNKLKSSKGITLIVLAVTVIVILILAGVSIRTIMNPSGIIKKSEKEKNEVEEGIEVSKKNQNIILEKLSKEKTGISKPYIPEGFIEDKNTNLDTGLVIKDPKGNEYVWIEVPNDGTGPDYFNVNGPKDYQNIEQAIKKYTGEYKFEENDEDKWYKDNTKGWFSDETEYNIAKNNMLKSVFVNGGFYIGRYEAGIGDISEIPVSKPNVDSYNNVTRTQAKVLAEKLSTAEYINTLMFGMQWDLVLKYLETKGVAPEDLKVDSTSWGNYLNSEIKNNEGIIKNKNKSKLLKTGVSENTKKQNIYDLAGNVWEWTLEYNCFPERPCSARGGFYNQNGLYNSAFSRKHVYKTGASKEIGFRFALYKN